MPRKGISLPIEMIIILAVAVLVLIVLAAFFIGGFGGSGGAISDTAAFSSGCTTLRFANNCARDTGTITIPNYKPPGVTTDQTLLVACQRTGRGTNDAECRVACGCPPATP